MTVRDLGAEYGFDDPDAGWFGAEQPVDEAPPQPTPVPRRPTVAPAPPARPRTPPPTPPPVVVVDDDSAADTDRWFVADLNHAEPAESEAARPAPVTESVAATLNLVPTRRHGFVRASPPASWESRIATSGAWEFKSAPQRSRRPPRAVITAAAALLAVAAVVGVVLIVRSTGDDAPAPAAPSGTATPSGSPAPSTPASATAPVAPVPPPVLPPPPPPAEEIVPPAVTRQYSPSYQTPDPPKKPQQNVTRAPLSATPPPPPRETDRGRATPGQSGAHGFFG